MDQVDIAWLAGIIEGEGWIGLRKSGRNNQPFIVVRMTDEDIIRRCFDITGEGTMTGPHPLRGMMTKPQWSWTVGDKRGVARILCAIVPMLGDRRRTQAALVADRLGEMRAITKKNAPIPHGTYNGYQRCRRRPDGPCRPCMDGHAEHARSMRREALETPVEVG